MRSEMDFVDRIEHLATLHLEYIKNRTPKGDPDEEWFNYVEGAHDVLVCLFGDNLDATDARSPDFMYTYLNTLGKEVIK